METLTKENFWDELYALYPSGTQVFCNWIDEYKAKVNWENLFNPMFKESNDVQRIYFSPKFHDLPYAIQLGIYIQFCVERGGCSYEVDLLDFDLREEITGMVKMLQSE